MAGETQTHHRCEVVSERSRCGRNKSLAAVPPEARATNEHPKDASASRALFRWGSRC
jgi:hypothetical protein